MTGLAALAIALVGGLAIAHARTIAQLPVQGHAAASEWHVISPSVGTIAIGISCISAQVCFMPVSINGVGTEIVRSNDGGVTWSPAQEEPFALLLLDIAAFGDAVNTDVAVVGALSMEYSTDGGKTFNSSLSQPGAGQCIRSVGVRGSEEGFAAVGQWGLFTESNGVVLSKDHGKDFATINSTLTAETRYGAFPSDTTWFISAGDWPGEGDDDAPPCDDPPCGAVSPFSARAGWVVDTSLYYGTVLPGSTLLRAKSARAHVLQAPNGDLSVAWVKKGKLTPANQGPTTHARYGNSTWEAQIGVTYDAGKTWNVSFSKMGQFYFNGIEATSTTNACAVGESDSGTYIWCTADSGATWTETFLDPDANSSLVDIAALGPNELWATGAELGVLGPKAPTWYHSTDGGVTWTLAVSASIPFQYGFAIDCIDGQCWTCLLDVLTQESSIAALN